MLQDIQLLQKLLSCLYGNLWVQFSSFSFCWLWSSIQLLTGRFVQGFMTPHPNQNVYLHPNPFRYRWICFSEYYNPRVWIPHHTGWYVPDLYENGDWTLKYCPGYNTGGYQRVLEILADLGWDDDNFDSGLYLECVSSLPICASPCNLSRSVPQLSSMEVFLSLWILFFSGNSTLMSFMKVFLS